MNGENIFGIFLMTFVNLMCGGIFYGIGIWATCRKDPMHFYSSSPINPKTISDIPAYNRENGKLWKTYSLPYWFCAVCAFGSIWIDVLMILSVTVLVFAGTAGIVWLILKYNKIHSTYMIR